ncbi:MAG: hypothetical protein BGO09_16525 [Bacteroidetes bacterium 47-18]|nr:MAG: hypothetical protein BGO09_16525 [Bacteroidetes bacterium 47-18]
MMEQSDNIFENYKEQMQAQEHNSETLPFDREQLWETITGRLEKQRPRKTVLFRNLGIAAGILLIISLGILYLQRTGDTSLPTGVVQQPGNPPRAAAPEHPPLPDPVPLTQADAAISTVARQTPAATKVRTSVSTPGSLPSRIVTGYGNAVTQYADSSSTDPTIAATLPITEVIPGITDSISPIRTASATRVPSTLVQALESGTTGVVVNNPSGQPGSAAAIRIRGYSSISGNSNPLYVVDGTIYMGDIADIDPADILSMDILKDDTATSQYGSRGSNGVIVITTKDGAYTEVQENGNLWDKIFKRKGKRHRKSGQ